MCALSVPRSASPAAVAGVRAYRRPSQPRSLNVRTGQQKQVPKPRKYEASSSTSFSEFSAVRLPRTTLKRSRLSGSTAVWFPLSPSSGGSGRRCSCQPQQRDSSSACRTLREGGPGSRSPPSEADAHVPGPCPCARRNGRRRCRADDADPLALPAPASGAQVALTADAVVGVVGILAEQVLVGVHAGLSMHSSRPFPVHRSAGKSR